MTTSQRIGWAATGLFALFMLGASVAPKLMGLPVAQETMVALGWSDAPILFIGIVELLATLLFLLPRTALAGAVLMTAVLGGAFITQLRAGSPMASHVLFSVYLGLMMWAALYLRDPRLRALSPWGTR
jgi:DoxX-like family